MFAKVYSNQTAVPVTSSRKLVTLILCVLIGIWCVKRPLHPQFEKSKAMLLSHFVEALAGTSLVESPLAHYLIIDFAQLGRYRPANRLLPPSAKGRVVFYGDSITDFWPTSFPAHFFPGKPYIGRGISGQSTPELVWRFQQDVLNLHPSVVVLLGGTNDVILPKNRLTTQQTIANIKTMVKMAQQHGIRVIVCSILPVSHFPVPEQKAYTARIKAINSALQSLAQGDHYFYLNYFEAMADQTGALRSTLSPDGVHPNAAGYAVMQTLAQSAIDQTSGKPALSTP